MSGADKHTPGPWHVVMVNTSQGPMPTIAVPLRSAFQPLVSGLYANIPVVGSIANAHLMATGHELLAAARAALAWWDEHQFDTTGDHGEYDVYPDTPAFVTAACAAIAEATGAAE